MATATISDKGRITLPENVREHLRVVAGDTIILRIDQEGLVTMRKIEAPDAGFLGLSTQAFADWNDPEAECAFSSP